LGGSRGYKSPPDAKFSAGRHPAKKFVFRGKTFGKPSHGRCAKKLQIEGIIVREPEMFRFLDHHPKASLWLIAIGQAAAMLGISIVLRSVLS
jgi:hypothetical protein